MSMGQQNLVPNGSFEDITGCPQNQSYGNGSSELQLATNWNFYTNGSSDLFHRCHNSLPLSTSVVGVPNNRFGEQEPYHGDAYAGFLVMQGNRGASRELMWTEYVTVKLTRRLHPNERLSLKFFINLAGNSSHAVSNINAVLTENFWEYHDPNSTKPLNLNGQFNLLMDTIYTDTVNWMLWQGEYTSVGCEEYLTIGYFNDSVTDSVYLNQSGFTDIGFPAVTYYYIDSVSMYSHTMLDEEEIVVPNVFTPNNDGIGDEFKLADKGKLEIYDRWGKLVSSNETVARWDGTNVLGNHVPEGTYYYIWHKYRGVCNNIEIKKGFVQVFR